MTFTYELQHNYWNIDGWEVSNTQAESWVGLNVNDLPIQVPKPPSNK